MPKMHPIRISMAEDRRKIAQERRDRLANQLYELMGWGTHAEIRRAEHALELANKELWLAEQNLEKVQKQITETGDNQ